MTTNELRRRFPRAAESFIRENADDQSPANPIMERHPRNEPLAAKEVQGFAGAGILVRVTSVRSRLIDEDNLCEKYHVDLCRYAGIIPDDAPGVCRIETTQRKAAKGEAQHSIIEVVKGTTRRNCRVMEVLKEV